MRLRKRVGHKPGALIRKVRKPVPPPTKVEENTTKYRRARERERLRREQAVTDPGTPARQPRAGMTKEEEQDGGA
jgi:hypothetical protein